LDILFAVLGACLVAMAYVWIFITLWKKSLQFGRSAPRNNRRQTFAHLFVRGSGVRGFVLVVVAKVPASQHWSNGLPCGERCAKFFVLEL
jgi:hypothetical protein